VIKKSEYLIVTATDSLYIIKVKRGRQSQVQTANDKGGKDPRTV